MCCATYRMEQPPPTVMTRIASPRGFPMRRFLQNALAFNVLAVVLLGFLAVAGWWRKQPHHDAMDNWAIDDVVQHIKVQNVPVRVVPVMENGPLSGGVFLTTTDKPWKHFNHLPLLPERIHDWDGTVYCARIGSSPCGDDWLWQWGDCAERQGPFVLFGDASLRERIKIALREPSLAHAPPRSLPAQPVPGVAD
jgi:hypothetical protein